MKKARFSISDMEARFNKEKLVKNKMNFLLGGDGNGSQPGTDDPWDPKTSV